MTPSASDTGDSGHNPRRVLKGFLGILTGSALAQLLAFAALPVLSRLYTPSETAHYAVLLGLGAVLASFAGLRLDLAIPIPKAADDSRGLFWLAALAPTVVLPATALLALILHLFGIWDASSLDLVDYLLVAVFVVAVTVFTAASQLAIRLRSYSLLGRIPVIQMVGTLVGQVALGAMGFGRGLFVGGVIGRSLGIVRLVRSCDIRLDQFPGRAGSVRLLREYWRFPVVFAPASLVEVLGSNLAALMLPSLFGFGPAGLYAMAVRVAGVPGTILSQSAGQVFLGEFARAPSRATSLRVFFRWSAALLCMAIVTTSLIWVLSPLVLPWLLGGAWSGTAELAQYAGVMAGAAIIGSPVQHVWSVRQRGFMQFSWNVVRLGTTAWVIWAGAKAGDTLAAVIANLAIATTAVYLLAWLGCLWAAASPSAGRQRPQDESRLDPAGPPP